MRRSAKIRWRTRIDPRLGRIGARQSEGPHSEPLSAKIILDGAGRKIVLYDISGREAAILTNEFKSAGYYTVLFNGSNLSSGIYFYRLETGGNVIDTKRMVLIK